MHRSARNAPSFLTLVALCGISVATLNLFVPSLANIASEFGVPYSLANLAVAGYAAVTGGVQLVAGPLSDRFGRRPIMLWSLLVFMIASAGCALAPSIQFLLAFRMMQAAIITGYVVSLAIIRDTNPTEKAASLLGYMAMSWAVAPMLAPIIGGTLDEFLGWRSNFWAFTALGCLMFAVCWFRLGETNLNKSTSVMDQFRTYPQLFLSRRFWSYSLCAAFSIGAFYAFLGGAPLVASEVFDISTAKLGFYMASTTIGFVVGSFLAGRFSERFSVSHMVIGGRIVALLGPVVGLLLIYSANINELIFFGSCTLIGVGNGLSLPGVNTGIMSIKPELAGSAAGISGALIVAGGALISGLTGTVLERLEPAGGLMTVMLVTCTLALLFAFYTAHLEK